MTNIIKCRFLDKDGEPRGREYSYKTEIPVEVGQIVDVPAPRQSDADSELKTKSVIVSQINVPEEEIYTVSRKVGSVFQNPRSQFFCLDTSSELAFGCENLGMPVEQINERVKYAQKSWNWKIFWTEIYLNCPVVKSKESHVALCQRCSRIS